MTKCRLLLFPQPWKEITFRIAPLTITIFEAVNFWSHSIRFVMSYSLLWCGITSQMWSVHWSVARMFFPIIEHFGVWRNNTTKIICNNNHHQVLACLNILLFGAWKWSCNTYVCQTYVAMKPSSAEGEVAAVGSMSFSQPLTFLLRLVTFLVVDVWSKLSGVGRFLEITEL